MLPQRSHAADHQVRACLGGILYLDLKTRLDPGAYHQAGLVGELHHRGLHGIKHLGNHGSDDTALNSVRVDPIDLQKHLQVDAVFVRCFGTVGAQTGLKEDLIILQYSDHQIGIADIDSKDHVCSSKSF